MIPIEDDNSKPSKILVTTRELKFNIIKTGIKNIKDWPKNGTIENVDNSFVININEDLAKYVLSLEKLIIYMHRLYHAKIKFLSSYQLNIWIKLIMRYTKEYWNQINIELSN